MNSENLAAVLEYMRLQEIELINSREYRMGIKAKRAFDDIRHFHFLAFLKREIKFRKIAHYSLRKIAPENNFKYGEYPKEEKRFVVYTCITGGYDNLQDPIYTHHNIDYVAFTDNQNLKSDVWEIRPIPEKIKKLDNNILINRYFKFNPFDVFEGYDYSLYVDGNILVISDVRNMINRINDTTGLAFHRHSSRNCIYKEAEVCRIEKRGNYKKIQEQLKEYKKLGFPPEFGLYEANIILVDLHNPCAKQVLTSWWDEFKGSKSFRDQIALPYVVWKCGFKFDDVGNLGINMHNNPKFKKVSHS